MGGRGGGEGRREEERGEQTSQQWSTAQALVHPQLAVSIQHASADLSMEIE